MRRRSFADGHACRKCYATQNHGASQTDFSLDVHLAKVVLVCNLTGKNDVADLDSDHMVRINSQAHVFRVCRSLPPLRSPKAAGTPTGDVFRNPGESISSWSRQEFRSGRSEEMPAPKTADKTRCPGHRGRGRASTCSQLQPLGRLDELRVRFITGRAGKLGGSLKTSLVTSALAFQVSFVRCRLSDCKCNLTPLPRDCPQRNLCTSHMAVDEEDSGFTTVATRINDEEFVSPTRRSNMEEAQWSQVRYACLIYFGLII